MPRVSIILPTFNRAHLLGRAVASVERQSFTDWELIIIDDGSTDATSSLVTELMRKDERIRYHYHSNRGLAHSRNAGIEIAHGEFITFIDSDDEYLPGHLALRVDFMNTNSNISFLHGGVEIIGNEFVADRNNPEVKISVRECIVGGTFFFRREIIRETGGFLDQYSDDSDFFERIRKKFLTEKLSFPTYRYYRTEEDSLCAIVEREGIVGIKKFRTQ